MTIDNNKYPLVIGDSELEVRRDLREERGYLITDKNAEQAIIFPRGTLEELAKADRDRGKAILDELAPVFFFDNTSITYDSINAIATKAWLKEYETYKDSKIIK